MSPLGFLLIAIIIALPIAWLASEFCGSRALRISMGILAIGVMATCIWALRDVFNTAVRAIHSTPDGRTWLTDKQLDDLHEGLFAHSGRSLVETNEAVLKLLFRSQVDANELTGEQYPNVKLIDFEHPERNQFHAINQFRIDTRASLCGLRRGLRTIAGSGDRDTW